MRCKLFPYPETLRSLLNQKHIFSSVSSANEIKKLIENFSTKRKRKGKRTSVHVWCIIIITPSSDVWNSPTHSEIFPFFLHFVFFSPLSGVSRGEGWEWMCLCVFVMDDGCAFYCSHLFCCCRFTRKVNLWHPLLWYLLPQQHPLSYQIAYLL